MSVEQRARLWALPRTLSFADELADLVERYLRPAENARAIITDLEAQIAIVRDRRDDAVGR